MAPIVSLESLLFSVAGGLLFWLGGVLKSWISDTTERRRSQVDQVDAVRRENRLLSESLHDHRNLMLKSGQWSRDTLPPFKRE